MSKVRAMEGPSWVLLRIDCPAKAASLFCTVITVQAADPSKRGLRPPCLVPKITPSTVSIQQILTEHLLRAGYMAIVKPARLLSSWSLPPRRGQRTESFLLMSPHYCGRRHTIGPSWIATCLSSHFIEWEGEVCCHTMVGS